DYIPDADRLVEEVHNLRILRCALATARGEPFAVRRKRQGPDRRAVTFQDGPFPTGSRVEETNGPVLLTDREGFPIRRQGVTGGVEKTAFLFALVQLPADDWLRRQRIRPVPASEQELAVRRKRRVRKPFLLLREREGDFVISDAADVDDVFIPGRS